LIENAASMPVLREKPVTLHPCGCAAAMIKPSTEWARSPGHSTRRLRTHRINLAASSVPREDTVTKGKALSGDARVLASAVLKGGLETGEKNILPQQSWSQSPPWLWLPNTLSGMPASHVRQPGERQFAKRPFWGSSWTPAL